jgi:hypothetical protein
MGTWLGGFAAEAIEIVTIDWWRQLCGFPEVEGKDSFSLLTNLEVKRVPKTQGGISTRADTMSLL